MTELLCNAENCRRRLTNCNLREEDVVGTRRRGGVGVGRGLEAMRWGISRANREGAVVRSAWVDAKQTTNNLRGMAQFKSGPQSPQREQGGLEVGGGEGGTPRR